MIKQLINHWMLNCNLFTELIIVPPTTSFLKPLNKYMYKLVNYYNLSHMKTTNKPPTKHSHQSTKSKVKKGKKNKKY